MKKIISILGISVALLFSGLANADTKIAIVDVVSILQKMPQREAVSKALEDEFSSTAKGLQSQEKKAMEAAQKLKKDGMTLSAAEKQKLSKIVSQFEENAKAFSTDYRKRENEEVAKLLYKIQEAVKAVAEQGKYDLVLKAETAFYVTDPIDITPQVLEQVKK
ncbi:OmpH family outer membrane protein [Orbaceae bacterium ac157xtp]